MKINGAFFDMDGTLVKSLIVWKDIWAAMADKYLGGEADFRVRRSTKSFAQ